MAKKSTKATETIEVEVLQDEAVLLEQQVQQEIKKYNLADAKIAELKEKYAGLKVRDLKDKEGLAQVKLALSEVVSIRTGIDKKRLALTGDYRKIVDAINGEAKRLTALIQEVEEPLRAEKERIDALIKEEKERKERELQEKLDARVSELKEAGMIFDGLFYVCGDTISMDVNTIRDMKDTDFDFLKAKVELEAERIRKAKEEEERRKAEEEAERRRIQDELERQQAELRKQQEELERQKAEMERQRREFEEAREREERERRSAILNNRAAELERIGMHFSNSRNIYLFSSIGGQYEFDAEKLNAPEEEWRELLSEAQREVTEIEIREKQEIEKEKEKERQRILKEQEEREARAKAEEEARLAALPDVEKVEVYLKSILEAPIPTINTPQIKSVLSDFVHIVSKCASEVIYELKKVKSGE